MSLVGGLAEVGVTYLYPIGCISGSAVTSVNATFAQLSLMDPRHPEV